MYNDDDDDDSIARARWVNICIHYKVPSQGSRVELKVSPSHVFRVEAEPGWMMPAEEKQSTAVCPDPHISD